MELAKCLRCEKLFNKVKLAVCQPCEIEEDKEIFLVRAYMRDHPGLTLEQVSNELNIYLEDIERWIIEKRLTVEIKQGAALKCLLCGASIITGRVCLPCSARLGLPPAAPPDKKPPAREPHLPPRDRDPGDFGAAQKYRRSHS